MNKLFYANSEALMLKALGDIGRFAKKIRGSIRSARTSPLIISEPAKCSDIALNARLQ